MTLLDTCIRYLLLFVLENARIGHLLIALGCSYRAMALAMAPHNVRVNAIGPGSIMTDVLAAVATNKSAMNKILSRTPMGRIGDPTEIGQVSPYYWRILPSFILK